MIENLSLQVGMSLRELIRLLAKAKPGYQEEVADCGVSESESWVRDVPTAVAAMSKISQR